MQITGRFHPTWARRKDPVVLTKHRRVALRSCASFFLGRLPWLVAPFDIIAHAQKHARKI